MNLIDKSLLESALAYLPVFALMTKSSFGFCQFILFQPSHLLKFSLLMPHL